LTLSGYISDIFDCRL